MKITAIKIDIKESTLSQEMRYAPKLKENQSNALLTICYLLFKESLCEDD
ncbi:hypothetical protein [Cellulosilyticum sp. WCF-2]|nr:hypothetical protein [Cellulosilyticum sp. WCF-2]